jgi:hypothetical protein
MSLPFNVRQSTGKQIYGRQLASMVDSALMHDQSIALSKDPNVYEKMMLDATVAHLKGIRKHMVAGSRWQMEPASSRPIDKKAAQVMEKLFELKLRRFSQARFNLAEGVFRGSSFARIKGQMSWINVFDDGIPRNFWVPTELVDVDRRRFDKVVHHRDRGMPTERLEVEWRMFDYAKNEWAVWEHPEWYVKNIYNDDEATLGYGRGLIDSMYFYWRAKEILFKMGLQGAERWALGFMVAKVDNARSASTGKTNQSIVNSFISELEKQRSQHYFVMDKIDELEVLPGPGQGHEIVKHMLDYCDHQLRLLVLGSNLPTEATKGGSYGMAEIQQGTMDTLIKFDRNLMAEALSTDLVSLTWNLNRPALFSMGLAAAEPPRFIILEEKINDPKLMAEVTEVLLRAGVTLKADETYELLGRTQPGPEDEVIEPPMGSSQMRSMGGQFGESTDMQKQIDAEEKKKPASQREGPPNLGEKQMQAFARYSGSGMSRDSAIFYAMGGGPGPVEHQTPTPAPVTMNNGIPEDKLRGILDSVIEAVKANRPLVSVNPEVRAPDVIVHSSPAIVVNPTPVTVTNENRIEVQPAPVTVQNEVNPTPVLIENKVEVKVDKRKPVSINIERDNEGNINRITPEE